MAWVALASALGVRVYVISRSEGDEMELSVEVTAMPEIVDVSLDWLVGHTDMALDKKMIQRIQEVTKMKPEDRAHVFAMLDAFIKQSRLQGVL